MDQMAFRGSHARRQIGDIGGEVHLFHRPGVFDGGLVHVEEDRVFHRPQGEREAGIQYHEVLPFCVTDKLRKKRDFPARKREPFRPRWARRWFWRCAWPAASAGNKLSSVPFSTRTYTWRRLC